MRVYVYVMDTHNQHGSLSILIEELNQNGVEDACLYRELAPLYDFMFSKQAKSDEYINRQMYETKNVINTGLVDSCVLEVGCGTGELLKQLEKEYEYVYGIDQHEEMVDISEQKVSDTNIIHGRLEEANIDVKFDGVIMYEYLISELVDIDEILLLLKRVNDVLVPGGAIVFDVVADEKVITNESIARIEDEDYRLIVDSWGQETEDENVYTKSLDMEINELQTGNGAVVNTELAYRVFGIDEIDTLVHDSGFEDVRLTEENGVITVNAVKPHK